MKRTMSIERIPVQSVITPILVNTLYPCAVHALIRKRLSSMFPEHADEVDSVDWDNVFSLMRGLGMHDAMCVMKSYVNSWSTS